MMNGGDTNEPNMNDIFNPEPDTTTLCTDTTATPSPYVGPKHHLAKTSCDQQSSGREFKEQVEIMGGSRWNPTAEQLLALEEKYRCGTRTPTTDQIQQIASELRRFGKIEGKNVFYWFQNHKARERQKRRLCQVQQKHNNSDHESLSKLMKESGACSVHEAEIAESGTNGWSEFEEKELQQMKSSSLDMHAMRHTIDLSSSPPAHHFKSTMTTTTSKFLSLEEHSSLLRPSNRE